MLNAFGRNYEEIGSSDKGLILKNSGKIKILWGRKFIDLLDSNGNINSLSLGLIKSISSSSLMQLNGFYLLDGSLIAKINDDVILLSSESNSVYVSFLLGLKSSGDEKYLALLNIGFIYHSINDYNVYPTNGIIYIEDTLTLYIVNNGNLSKYSVSIPNSINELFTIINNGLSDGSLVILGEGNSNSIKFNSLKIYSSNNSAILDIKGDMKIIINNEEIVTINNGGLETNFITTNDIDIKNFPIKLIFDSFLNLYKNEELLISLNTVQILGTGTITIEITSNLSWNVESENIVLSKNYGIGNDSFDIICNTEGEIQEEIVIKDILYDRLYELYPDNLEILGKHLKTIEFTQTSN